MDKNKIIPVGILLVLILAVAGLLAYRQNSADTPPASPGLTPVPPESSDESGEEPLGSDRDEYGCIGSAGYRWCAPKEKCLRFWEESCYTADEELLGKLFVEKYKKPAAEIAVSIDILIGEHARGSVRIGPPGPDATGALFFAVKTGGQWKIVHDGNGEILCSVLEPYKFPAELTEDCIEPE